MESNHFSWAQVQTFRQCPRKWFWSRQWEPIEKSSHLLLDTMIREALAYFYSHSPDVRDFCQLEGKINENGIDADPDTCDTAYTMMKKYWDKYGEDENIIPLEIKHEINYLPHQFIFCPDMVIKQNDCIYLWENKTGKVDLESLIIDDVQSRIYGHLHPMAPIGVIFNIIRPNGECHREPMVFAYGECELMWNSVCATISQMKRGFNHMHPGYSCKFCEFREPCRLLRWGLPTEAQFKENYKRVSDERD